MGRVFTLLSLDLAKVSMTYYTAAHRRRANVSRFSESTPSADAPPPKKKHDPLFSLYSTFHKLSLPEPGHKILLFVYEQQQNSCI